MTRLDANKIKILVAEDDDDLRESIAKLFQIFGFHVVTAKDGVQALELAKSSLPDLVLTDIRMPNKSGVDLISQLRALNHDTPKIFAISGFTDYSVAELLNFGADGFFPKPFDATAVRFTLNNALVDRSIKLSHPVNENAPHEINKKITSLSEAQKSGEFLLGRGGFFANDQLDKQKIGDFVKFKIEIADGLPHTSLEGIGQIAWSADAIENIAPAGVGVEFKQLAEPCLQNILNWSKKNKIIPYIPAPKSTVSRTMTYSKQDRAD